MKETMVVLDLLSQSFCKLVIKDYASKLRFSANFLI
jgi:hypothetical protein